MEKLKALNMMLVLEILFKKYYNKKWITGKVLSLMKMIIIIYGKKNVKKCKKMS